MKYEEEIIQRMINEHHAKMRKNILMCGVGNHYCSEHDKHATPTGFQRVCLIASTNMPPLQG